MPLNKNTIDHIASLARIRMEPEESDRYAAELSNILQFVEQMNQVDTEQVEPLTHPQDRTLRMREDVVTEEDQRDEYQKVAPSTQDGLYLVPKVIE